MLFNLFFPLWLMVTPVLSFGAPADTKLAALDFFFAVRMRAFLALVKLFLGLDVLVVSGRRTFAEQTRMHQADSRNPAPSVSAPDIHIRGLAADLNFMRRGVLVLLKGSPPSSWSMVYAFAQMCGISNGSGFPGYADNNHFYRS